MSRVPDEPLTWVENPDPQAVLCALREQIARARARMNEHREVMRAAGLTGGDETDLPHG